MTKVLLIQPHQDIKNKEGGGVAFTPLSLVYLGTVIEDRHQIKIYDRNLNNNDEVFLKFLKEYNPDIVGLTSVVSTILFDVMHLGKLIKEVLPKTIIVVGGVHATVDPDSVLNEPYVDYIIRGEGEEAFLEFCDTFEKNPKELKKLKNINKNPLRPLVDINKLKLPNYKLLDLDKYEQFYINLTRGCVGNCSFCYNVQMWGKDCKPFVRSYSIEKTIELMKKIVEEYKIKNFHIIDDNFLFFKTRCIEVCNFLKKYDVNFYTVSRADSINDEVLNALKDAGCHTISIGVESGSQKMLDLLDKKITVEQNINAIKLCKKHKIKCHATFMIGLPTETVEELNKTINFIKKYNPDVPDMHMYNPLPAKLFEYCISKGLLKRPVTLEEWAKHGGVWGAFKNNVSEIPEQKLKEAIEQIQHFQFFRKKIKRAVFWIRRGEYEYVFKKVREVFNRREDSSANS